MKKKTATVRLAWEAEKKKATQPNLNQLASAASEPFHQFTQTKASRLKCAPIKKNVQSRETQKHKSTFMR